MKFFSYEDIPLKLFMLVNSTGNARLLVKSGVATASACVAQWENIIQENNKARGNQEYNIFLKTYAAYNRLLQDFNGVKSHLLILCYVLDYDAVKYVRAKGYKIDLSNSAKYSESLAAAMRKSDNLITKITLKKNELERMSPAQNGSKPQSFETLMALMSFELGYTLPDDITLVRFNEYIKLIEVRARQQKKQKEQAYGRRA